MYSRKEYRKHLTPESQRKVIAEAEKYLQSDKVPEMHKRIITMFAFQGMSARSISRTGEIIGKRGCMDSDMISIWIKRYFPDVEYDEKPNNCKRGHNSKHIYAMKVAKKKLMAENPCCAICGATENLEIDHKLAVVFGGGDDMSNFQLLCHTCHWAKTRRERRIVATKY